MGSSCFARGNDRNLEVCEDFLARHGLKDDVDIVLEGSLCAGNCAKGPVVKVNDKLYTGVDKGVMNDIMEKLFPISDESRLHDRK